MTQILDAQHDTARGIGAQTMGVKSKSEVSSTSQVS